MKDILSENERAEWEQALKRNSEGMDGCEIFMSLWSDNVIKDPLCLMQFGLAIMKNKPIYILAPFGADLPANIKRLAMRVIFHDGTPEGIARVASELKDIIRNEG